MIHRHRASEHFCKHLKTVSQKIQEMTVRAQNLIRHPRGLRGAAFARKTSTTPAPESPESPESLRA